LFEEQKNRAEQQASSLPGILASSSRTAVDNPEIRRPIEALIIPTPLFYYGLLTKRGNMPAFILIEQLDLAALIRVTDQNWSKHQAEIQSFYHAVNTCFFRKWCCLWNCRQTTKSPVRPMPIHCN
jgi:hypothetical protein